MTAVAPFDPRPTVQRIDDQAFVRGFRCTVCGHVVAGLAPWCPACRGPLEAAAFGPRGRVWSATVVRFVLPGRTPPYVLAYVDLDDGPRVIGHVQGADPDNPDAAVEAPAVGVALELIGCTDGGDLGFRLSAIEGVS